MSERMTALSQWVEHIATSTDKGSKDWFFDGAVELTPINGDAGFRRYFRLNTHPALLAVDAPPESENSEAFVSIANFLRVNGVHTPNIVAVDLVRGFLIIEDLGRELYLPALLNDGPELLYGEAMMILLRMQQASPSADCVVPYYDNAKLISEMALFPEWFVGEMLGIELNADERVMIDEAFTLLAESALEQPQVFVHRDFHSRNLVLTDGSAPGVIDFQDAVWGPITYDLVSMFKDCYIRWPREQVEHWAGAYGDMAVDAGLMPAISKEQFIRWFDLMGLQRHLKVLGIFARLSLRDHKTGYLQDIPLVVRYVVEVCERYDEFQVLADWFKRRLLSELAEFDWYSDYSTAGDRA